MPGTCEICVLRGSALIHVGCCRVVPERNFSGKSEPRPRQGPHHSIPPSSSSNRWRCWKRLPAAGLHGNEVGLSLALSRTLKRIEPTWKLVSPKETATRINQAGLAAEYAPHEDRLRAKRHP